MCRYTVPLVFSYLERFPLLDDELPATAGRSSRIGE